MKKVIAFDLDDTLSVAKSPISDRMGELLVKLVEKYEVCIISGGRFEQFEKQVISRLEAEPALLTKFHMMPTCGTRYYRFNEVKGDWSLQYAEDLTDEQKKQIIRTLKEGAIELGLWEEHPYGEVIEDRLSQITFSALGQQAPPDKKYQWDPDGKKKLALRDYVAPLLQDFEVRTGGTTSVDVTRAGIDKAYDMNKLIEALSIDKTDILFIGDKLQEGGNDYPVRALGIDTIEVEKWQDTAFVLEGVLGVTG